MLPREVHLVHTINLIRSISALDEFPLWPAGWKIVHKSLWSLESLLYQIAKISAEQILRWGKFPFPLEKITTRPSDSRGFYPGFLKFRIFRSSSFQSRYHRVSRIISRNLRRRYQGAKEWSLKRYIKRRMRNFRETGRSDLTLCAESIRARLHELFRWWRIDWTRRLAPCESR